MGIIDGFEYKGKDGRIYTLRYPGGPCGPECPGTIKIPKIDLFTGDISKEKDETIDLNMYNGEGMLAQPFESAKYLDLEFPIGSGTGVYYSLLFQLGKWAYERSEVKHAIEVSPVYNEYYQLVMGQKEKLDNQIKSGFAGLVQAVQDFELIDHDLRKYSEYLTWFAKLIRKKRIYEKAKDIKNEEGLKKTPRQFNQYHSRLLPSPPFNPFHRYRVL